MPRFWEEIRLDLNPPLMYLAARYSLQLFGDSEYSARLPAILAFLAGSLCLYWFVSRRLPPVYGLFAVLVFWWSPAFYLPAEARPYGLIIGMFGIATLAWQRRTETRRSRVSIIDFGFAVTGMMLSHFFAVFYITPFCLAELVRWYILMLAFVLAVLVALPRYARYYSSYRPDCGRGGLRCSVLLPDPLYCRAAIARWRGRGSMEQCTGLCNQLRPDLPLVAASGLTFPEMD